MYIPSFLLEEGDLQPLVNAGIIKGSHIYKNTDNPFTYYVINSMGLDVLVQYIYSNAMLGTRDAREVEFITRNVILIFSRIIEGDSSLNLVTAINSLYPIASNEAMLLLSLVKFK